MNPAFKLPINFFIIFSDETDQRQKKHESIYTMLYFLILLIFLCANF